jgi:hypothetical protein
MNLSFSFVAIRLSDTEVDRPLSVDEAATAAVPAPITAGAQLDVTRPARAIMAIGRASPARRRGAALEIPPGFAADILGCSLICE